MPRVFHIKQQAIFQAAYMEVLQLKAKKIISKSGVQNLNFDPQGRVLVDVELTDEDLESLKKTAKKMGGDISIVSKLDEFNHIVGYQTSPSNVTTISMDIDSIPNLQQEFKNRLLAANPKLNSKQVDSFLKSARGSVIPLHQEIRFHMAGAKRVFEKYLANELFPNQQNLIDKAFQTAESALNKLILEEFSNILQICTSTNQENQKDIDVALLNKELDAKRKTLGAKAQQLLLQELRKRANKQINITNKKLFKEKIKHLAETTSATANDILVLDQQLGTATLIRGTEETAHNRKITPPIKKSEKKTLPTFAHRQIITHSFKKGIITKSSNARIQIRTPSPVVKENISNKIAISDVVNKLNEIKHNYQLNNSLKQPGIGIPKAYIYNRFTAINHWPDGKNKQTQSAEHILKGMHIYNKREKRSSNSVFNFVQNISVNGFGSQLGYGVLKDDITAETTLLAEISMLHSLYEILSPQDKSRYKDVIEKYNQYLDNIDPNNPIYFIKYDYGDSAKQIIQSIKNNIKNLSKPIETENIVTNAKFALLNLMANNKHFSHDYAKTIQALSVFIEHASIAGCKSGNERAESITKRVSILDALLSGTNIENNKKPNLKQALKQVAINPDGANCSALNNALNQATNAIALQSATVVISHTDQLSGAKVKPARTWFPTTPTKWTISSTLTFIGYLVAWPYRVFKKLFDTNEAEDSSMSNLKQSGASNNQAHKGFSGNFLKGLTTPIPSTGSSPKEDHEKSRSIKESYLLLTRLKQPYKEPVNINVKKLCAQIDNYDVDFDEDKNGKTAFDRLVEQSKGKQQKPLDQLLTDRQKYRESHANKVENYKNHPPFEFPDFVPSSYESYFREAFIYYLEKRLAAGEEGIKGYSFKDNDIRTNYPTKAMISMRMLLGKVGEDLFNLALQEEVNSDEYRKAVFNKASTYYPGATWKHRPVVYIGGPSASGKTFSTKAAIKETSELFEKNPNAPDPMAGNFVTASDGGIARELSQIRNLVIEAAVAKGYTGISDLQKKSNKHLGPIKNHVKKAALASDDLGVAIPETFANPLKRFGFGSSLKELEKSTKSGKQNRTVFIMVEGKPSVFKNVVNYMGNSRALKIVWPKKYQLQKFGLNRTKAINIPESKVYESQYFEAGLNGSRSAFNTFKKSSRDGFSIVAQNDLVLKCPKDPNDPNSEWIDGVHDSPGVIMISLRVLKRWEMLKTLLAEGEVPFDIKEENMKSGKKVPSKEEIILASKNLSKFMEINHCINNKNPVKAGKDVIFANPLLPPMIKTSAEINIALAVNKLLKRVTKKSKRDSKKDKALSEIITNIGNIYNIDPRGYKHFVDIDNEPAINKTIGQIQNLMSTIKPTIFQKLRLRDSKYKILKNIQAGLSEALTVIECKKRGLPTYDKHKVISEDEYEVTDNEVSGHIDPLEQNVRYKNDTIISASPLSIEQTKSAVKESTVEYEAPCIIYAELANDKNIDKKALFKQLDNGELSIKLYHTQTQLNEKNYQALTSPKGLKVISPGKIVYTLHRNVDPNKGFSAVLKHEDITKLTDETLEQNHQRRALTIINMLDNVLSQSTGVHMKTSSTFDAIIAYQYIEYLKGCKNMDIEIDIDLRNTNMTSNAKQEKNAEKISNKLAPQLDASIDKSPWYAAAMAYREKTHNVSRSMQM